MDFLTTQLVGFGGAFLALILDPWSYVYITASMFLGIVFGALPGLTATLAVAVPWPGFGITPRVRSGSRAWSSPSTKS